jgi:hypothetical protein
MRSIDRRILCLPALASGLVKLSVFRILSIGGSPIRALSMKEVSAALGKPGLYESTSSPDSKFEQSWTWPVFGISASLDENGEVTRLAADPIRCDVVISGKKIPPTEKVFLARFPQIEPSEGDAYEMLAGNWRIEVVLKSDKRKPREGEISRVIVRPNKIRHRRR